MSPGGSRRSKVKVPHIDICGENLATHARNDIADGDATETGAARTTSDQISDSGQARCSASSSASSLPRHKPRSAERRNSKQEGDDRIADEPEAGKVVDAAISRAPRVAGADAGAGELTADSVIDSHSLKQEMDSVKAHEAQKVRNGIIDVSSDTGQGRAATRTETSILRAHEGDGHAGFYPQARAG